ALVRRAHPFAELGDRALESTLEMLAGAYPADEFAELRARVVWDRARGTVRGRSGTQRLAVTNAGTIPDRGLYPVTLFDDGRRVGELDEEMVYEMRPGETFVLGATTWRVAEITPTQVQVTPAPGEPGRTAFVERFRDQLGDWRVCVLTPFGARVHAPWALAATARLRERLGVDVQAIHSDDGFAVRLPDVDHPPPVEELLLDPDEASELVTASLGPSALFAARFRENAARALLLPRRRPGERTPLWKQRQRSHDLLQVAARHASFPIIVETLRECL